MRALQVMQQSADLRFWAMGSYTFMEGDYPGATVADADAQYHGSIVRRSMQLRGPVAPGIYTSRSTTTESDELAGR